MQNDWRLTNQRNYLYRAALKKADFKAVPHNDHEHCEFCFEKFGLEEGCLKSGYCSLDGYRWICGDCFRDFREQFEWSLEDA